MYAVDFHLLDISFAFPCLWQTTLKLTTVPVSAVLQLGLKHTLSVHCGHNMDLTNTASPQSCLERVESVLQQHEALLASTTAEVHQAAASQQQALAALTAQVQQNTAALSQMAAPAPSAVPSSATLPPAIQGPISEPRELALACYVGDPEN